MKKGYLDLYGREPYETPTADVLEVALENTVAASAGVFNPFNNDGTGNEQFMW